MQLRDSSYLLLLSPEQIAIYRRAIDRFVRQYPAALPLLQNGLRSGYYGEIVDRDKKVVVTADRVRRFCEFIHYHGYILPRDVRAYSMNGRVLAEPHLQ